ncbi:MAG: DUF6069 family protein [Candidatus Promineifilaceae bacterium]|jgi:magnesium-transporting ATPase (P-type)
MTAPTVHKSEAQLLDTAGLSGRLVWVGPLAVALAALANVLFYYFVTWALQITMVFPEQFPPPIVTQLPVTEVVLFSFIFGAGAVIVFWFVARFSRHPAKTYLAISAAVLLISILLPLKIPTPPVPVSSKYSLVIMHIIGAFVVVGFLMALCQPERQSKS